MKLDRINSKFFYGFLWIVSTDINKFNFISPHFYCAQFYLNAESRTQKD